MNLATIFRRAERATRQGSRLHWTAVVSLTVAFLCLSLCLLALTNLSAVAQEWNHARRMTIYFKRNTVAQDAQELRWLLRELTEIRNVRFLPASVARHRFAQQANLGSLLPSLPEDAFPASLEAELAPQIQQARLAQIVERVKQFSQVEDVETYQNWFSKMHHLVSTGQIIAWFVALLVVICVIAVVGSTLRLTLAARQTEIEILKLCGATNHFVQSPFFVEGAMQGFVAATFALGIVAIGFWSARVEMDATLAAFTGLRVMFLAPATCLMLLLGGGLLGALASALCLQRHLRV